ncbi:MULTISPECIES: hypothetical protein [unclassified Microcoleus]|uniref:hypothetical protein n=1 Tax=unclassified Microcoleus TaxID=2642155 RepID=UPI002FD18C9F
MTIDEALLFLDSVLKQEHLNDVHILILRQTWEGHSYREIAKSAGYDAEYIKFVGFQLWQVLSRVFGEKVTKSNFQSVLRRQAQQAQVTASLPNSQISHNINEQVDRSEAIADRAPTDLTKLNKTINWGEAIDVSIFYARAEELALLEQWLIVDRCLVTLLGMGGIGKPLSIKVVERIPEQFDYIIWHSLYSCLSFFYPKLAKSLLHQGFRWVVTPSGSRLIPNPGLLPLFFCIICHCEEGSNRLVSAIASFLAMTEG